MEILNKATRSTPRSLLIASTLGLLVSLLTACGPQTVTDIQYVETDTYISSGDASAHHQLSTMNLSKTATLEERVLLKLPTAEKDEAKSVKDALAEAWLWMFYMPLMVIEELINCRNDIIKPENLQSSDLLIDVASSAEPAPAGMVQLEVLNKGWWHNASWLKAHPFSTVHGSWSVPGGEVDPVWTPVAATGDTTTLSFRITSYFQDLITKNGQGLHYGFLIRSAGATLNPIVLKSTQWSVNAVRPRLVSVYTGSCVPGSISTNYRTTVTLGDDRTIRQEVVNP